MATHCSIPKGQRRLMGYSPWGRKESETTKQLNTQSTEVRKRGLKYFSEQVNIYIYIYIYIKLVPD